MGDPEPISLRSKEWWHWQIAKRVDLNISNHKNDWVLRNDCHNYFTMYTLSNHAIHHELVQCYIAIPHFPVLLHFADTAFLVFFFFTNWRFMAALYEQVYWCQFSNCICSFHVSVSHFGNSCNNSNFKNYFSVCDGDLCSVIIPVTAMTHWRLRWWLAVLAITYF